MKSILISIKPEWVEKILNGEKTIEIRKSIPKCELPCKVYIYCTKNKGKSDCLFKCNSQLSFVVKWAFVDNVKFLNGKVVAEFTLNKVEELEKTILPTIPTCVYLTKTKRYASAVEKASCLSQDEIYTYLSGRDGCAWYIDDLKIYDTPKELTGFSKYGFESLYGSSICGNSSCPFYLNSNSYDLPPECLCEKQCQIKRPPQSWCYVEEMGE